MRPDVSAVNQSVSQAISVTATASAVKKRAGPHGGEKGGHEEEQNLLLSQSHPTEAMYISICVHIPLVHSQGKGGRKGATEGPSCL